MSLNENLLRACRGGDLNQVKTLIKQGANPNFHCPRSFTMPLNEAAANGHLEIVQYLHSKGASLEQQPSQQASSLLQCAVYGEDLNVLRFLLQKRVPVDTADGYGITGLHEALESGLPDFVAVFLAAGASVHVVGHTGRTAAHYAAQGANMDCLKMLLAAGASFGTPDQTGRTPLFHAVEVDDDNLKAAAFLLDHAPNSAVPDSQGVTPAHLAAVLPESDALTFLANRGCDVNHPDNYGFRPAHWAVIYRNACHLPILLQHGLNLQATTSGNIPGEVLERLPLKGISVPPDGLSLRDIAINRQCDEVMPLLDAHRARHALSSLMSGAALAV